MLGQLCVCPGQMSVTCDRVAVVSAFTGPRRIYVEGAITTVQFQRDGQPPVYCIAGGIPIARHAFSWLADELKMIDSPEHGIALASTVPDAGGVVFVTALHGLYTPEWEPLARAAIFGLGLSSTREHVCRAALDSIARMLSSVFTLLRSALEAVGIGTSDELRIGGDMASHDHFLQIVADVLNTTITVHGMQ
jgi:glycerol kinase